MHEVSLSIAFKWHTSPRSNRSAVQSASLLAHQLGVQLQPQVSTQREHFECVFFVLVCGCGCACCTVGRGVSW